ncbi:MAG: DUF7948 domain-containing protein, partial [Candidatus Heimdallarchaeota archaeon]
MSLKAKYKPFFLVILLVLMIVFVNQFSTSGDIPKIENIQSSKNLDSKQLFVENNGQLSNDEIMYYREITGGKIGFGESKVFVYLGKNLYTLDFPEANKIIPIAIEEQKTTYNFFLGSRGTFTDVNLFNAIVFYDLWSGIDLIYYTNNDELKYDFVIQPKANPKDIQIECNGFDSLSISHNQITLSSRNFRFFDEGLKVYQKDEQVIPAKFKAVNSKTYGFDIENYDNNQQLIIDPIIYSTFHGGSSSDKAESVKVDSLGNVIVCGSTSSSDFPAESGYDLLANGQYDIFVTKFSASGAIIYSTFIGGNQDDYAYDMVLDTSNSIYVTGSTSSNDFPLVNAYQASKGTGADCFILKLAYDGASLTYSTFLGGDSSDVGNGIAVNSTGHAHIVGETQSTDYPLINDLSMPIADTTNSILSVLSPIGDTLVFSTLIGGNGFEAGHAIALDDESAYITGRTTSTDIGTIGAYQDSNNGGTECYIAKVNLTGPVLDFISYMGGSDFDLGWNLALDNAGFIYCTGFTEGNFPIQSAYDSSFNGNRDVFVFKMYNDGSDISYSTYIGGSNAETGRGIFVNPATGVVYITGATESNNYPMANPYDDTFSAHTDCFVTKVADDGLTLNYSTYIGSDQWETGYSITVDSTGKMFVVGSTSSPEFPTFNA